MSRFGKLSGAADVGEAESIGLGGGGEAVDGTDDGAEEAWRRAGTEEAMTDLAGRHAEVRDCDCRALRLGGDGNRLDANDNCTKSR